jgi:DNA-binding winged helix-turn-helix (wHTH) protein/TolB-like protein
MSLKNGELVEFGPFRLDLASRTLWRSEALISLTPKAVDTLVALVRKRGELVEKDELLKAVWPDSFVEEGNLAVQISLLRKTLGEESYIETVPRRGYRFAAPIREMKASPSADRSLPGASRRILLAAGAGATVTAIAGGAWYLRGRQAPDGPRSIAVLPFQMLRASAGDELLGMGLTDAVITRLGSLDKFTVRPTSAIRQFDQPQHDSAAAGRKLEVDAVLDATIQAEAGRVRVSAQLIRVEDGRHVWSEAFDLERANLFALEDELASRMARSLFGAAPAGTPYRAKPEAHRLFMLGQHHRNRWTAASQRVAIDHFQKAVDLDPGYAMAHAYLADSWALLGYLFGAAPKDAFPRAAASAAMALRLDEQLSAAHHSSAVVRVFFDRNWKEGEHHLLRALACNPNNADSHQVLGVLRAIQGRHDEGIAAVRRSLEIEPASQWRHIGMAFQYACAGRVDDGIAEARKAQELDPALLATYHDLFNFSMVAGRYQEAVEWQLKAPANRDPLLAGQLRQILAREGIKGYLRARIARNRELEKAGTRVSPMIMTQLNGFLGDIDEAVRWLAEAVEQRLPTALFVRRHPMYAPLRGHRKFEELVQQMGI